MVGFTMELVFNFVIGAALIVYIIMVLGVLGKEPWDEPVISERVDFIIILPVLACFSAIIVGAMIKICMVIGRIVIGSF